MARLAHMSRRRIVRGARPWVSLVSLIALACTNPPPPTPVAPTPTGAGIASPAASATPTAAATSTPAPTPPPKVVGDLALEQCDPENAIPCEHQAVLLSELVVGTGVALTYSSEWADGRLDRPVWRPDTSGLGGWSIDVMERYDAENGVLLDGDGGWRLAEPTELDTGEMAIPSYDARQFYVFDAEWRHVRTVDGITGAAVLSFTYDQ